MKSSKRSSKIELVQGKRILVFGGTGLVGSAFVDRYRQSCLTAGRQGCEITLDLSSKKQIARVIKNSGCRTVVNFVAYTKVDEAEKQKGDRSAEVYVINAQLPFWVAQICHSQGLAFYHLSTDYVFDGRSETRPYTEADQPHPVDSWYCQTKYLGEEKVKEAFGKDHRWGIVRISFPYAHAYERKLDITRAVIARLKNNEEYLGIVDQKIKPTSVDEIAKALSLLISKTAFGIYHVAGAFPPKGYITPFDLARLIAKKHHLKGSLIKPITFAEFASQRIAPRPQHTWLDTTKIETLGMRFKNGYV